MNATEESRTTTTFDGKKENYGVFSSQLLGEFMKKGIHRTLGPNFKDELPASENASGQSTKEKNAVKDNITAMGCIRVAVKSAPLLVKIEGTVSEEWPYGRVDHAMEVLDKKFRPKDRMARAEQKQRIGELTLKVDEDPDNYNVAVATLELEYRNTLSEEDKIAALIGVAGEKYATTIHGEQKLIESRNEEVTFEALVEAMREVWRMSRSNSKAGKNNDETALGSVQTGDFPGNCYNCGNRGHKGFACPFKKNPSSGGKKCDLCGTMGHNTEDCWEDPKNEGRRCKNWVSRKKRKTGDANGSCVEIFL